MIFPNYNYPMAIEIGTIGYNHIHDKDFVANFPSGPGAYLFLLIKANSIFTIAKKNYKVQKKSYVIINPKTKVTYKGEKDNYVDDWFFFWINEEDKKIFIEWGIEFDKPVNLGSIDELSKIIQKISYEHFSGDKFHKEIKQEYTRILFFQLSRLISSRIELSPSAFSSKNDRIIYLRTRIFENPAYFKNIDEMAYYINISRSGLQHQYTSIFGHGIMEDVITARIEIAKKYLKETNLTLSEIGTKCGYKTEYHFMRQFKEYIGLTPTEFRNINF